MLFAVAFDPSDLNSLPQGLDGVEIRFDAVPNLSLPILLNSQKWDLLRHRPAYCDLDCHLPPETIRQLIEDYPETKFILSYHNFRETPDLLEPIFEHMSQFPAWGYKIATQANSALDTLRLLQFCQKHPQLTGIPMGERGQFGRILGPIFGNPIGYAGKREDIGQLSTEEMLSTYHYAQLNANTAIYGLIGETVSHSLGHLYHNRVFRERGQNAIYVKIPLRLEELDPFIAVAETSGFRGLSITMPFKKRFGCLPINTLLFRKEGRSLYNTDGKAALGLLGSVAGKILVILGAGGAAEAIAREALLQGAKVHIHNRTPQKGQALARDLGCLAGDIPAHYDILVNATADASPRRLLPEALVLDVNYGNGRTLFTQHAQDQGCNVISGEVLFHAQACLQSKLFS